MKRNRENYGLNNKMVLKILDRRNSNHNESNKSTFNMNSGVHIFDEKHLK